MKLTILRIGQFLSDFIYCYIYYYSSYDYKSPYEI
jgi:hypothetical protein